jgi:uncharacterized protein (UPF0335 family)
MTDDLTARLAAAEMQQFMSDEALRSLDERIGGYEQELTDLRQQHHEQMTMASAALDAAMAEIERLRAENAALRAELGRP